MVFSRNKLYKRLSLFALSLILAISGFDSVISQVASAVSTPNFNGIISGSVGANESGVVSGETSGAYATSITGILTEYIPGQKGSFIGKITGDIEGDVAGGINYNGFDTLSTEITNSGASGYVYLIGYFTGPMGHFEGKFVTQADPIDFVTSISVSGGHSVELGKTLQMSAVTSPTEAEDDIAWTVWTNSSDPDRGSATIDEETGLLTATGVGPITVIASALDGSLVTQNYSVSITPDITGPTVPIITTPNSEQYFSSVPILNSWSASFDISGVKQYQIEYVYDDGHTFSGAPYRYVDSPSTSRNHMPSLNEQGGATIRVRAIDTFDNYGEWSSPVHYYYDSINPVKPNLTSPFNGVVMNGKVVAQSWSSSDTDIDYYIYESYNDAAATSLRWRQTVSSTTKTANNIKDCTYWWRVKSVDYAGNESPWSDLWKISIDNTKPTIPNAILFAGGNIIETNGYTNSKTFTFNLFSSADTTRYQLKYWNDIEGSRFKENSPWNPTNLSPYSSSLGVYNDKFTQGDGMHYFSFSACDAANNCSDYSEPFRVVYDTIAPTATLDFPTPGPTAKSFTIEFSEVVNKVEAENPENYFLNNWPTAGGSGDLVGDASITYDVATRTATVNFINSGWYVSPEQNWGIQNIHDLAGNLLATNPTSGYSTPMVAPVTTPVLDGVVGLNNFYISDVTVDLDATDGDNTVGSGVKNTFYSIDGSEYVSGNVVLINTEGEHTLLYYSEDNAGNVEIEKSISFKINTTAPEITVVGGDFTLEFKEAYIEQGATWKDMIDGVGTVTNITGFVDPFTLGSYVVTYSVTNSAGNTAIKTRTVTVKDTTAPMIILNGDSLIKINVGDIFTDPGATTEDGLTIVVDNPVDTTTAGTYLVTYDAQDASGNEAIQVTRTVIVESLPLVLGTTTVATTTTSIQKPSSNNAPQDSEDENQSKPELLGAETEKEIDLDTAVSSSGDVTGVWRIIGLAWYWWLMILAAVGYGIWWILGRRAGREE